MSIGHKYTAHTYRKLRYTYLPMHCWSRNCSTAHSSVALYINIRRNPSMYTSGYCIIWYTYYVGYYSKHQCIGAILATYILGLLVNRSYWRSLHVCSISIGHGCSTYLHTVYIYMHTATSNGKSIVSLL